VSIPPDLRRKGHARAKDLGISFSRFITLLLQNDLRAPEAPFVVMPPRRLTKEDVARASRSS